jgi:hypothetical protein
MHTVMRRTEIALVVLALLASCRSIPTNGPSDISVAIGAPSPRAAVDMYMTAMQKGDFTLIGNIWGSRQGLARDQYPRDEFEKRAFVVSCYLGWAGYRITSDRPAVDNGRTLMVQSTTSGHEQEAALRVEQNPAGRWLVAGTDVAGLSPDQCTRGSSQRR